VPVEVLDDGTTSNENRLGAIGDIRFGMERSGWRGDWLVVAGDNLFSVEFCAVVDFFREKQTDVVTCYRQPDRDRLRRTGVATLGDDGQVLELAEKPAEPRSNWAVPPLYVYTEATLRVLPVYLEEGNPSDAPGNFLSWLCQRKAVYAFRCEAGPHDVGSLESYKRVDELYSEDGP
jgi:glucose-1-phosphate thymidylyltransferase